MGKSVSNVSYWKFKQDTGQDPGMIPGRAEEFSSCMSKLFGPGYKIIEASIADELKKEFGLHNTATTDYCELLVFIKGNALKKSL